MTKNMQRRPLLIASVGNIQDWLRSAFPQHTITNTCLNWPRHPNPPALDPNLIVHAYHRNLGMINEIQVEVPNGAELFICHLPQTCVPEDNTDIEPIAAARPR